jgi:hypothetical protein
MGSIEITMNLIGLGGARTSTLSLKLAIERLGFGPCHHMQAVIENMAAQVPLWSAAIRGRPDWDAIYASFESAANWPTAGFSRELAQAYPSARFVLTHRDPGAWADSFNATV